MNLVFSRRAFALTTGLALVLIGTLEIWISKSDFENPSVQALCQAGLCATQFSLERIFEIGQKATLGDAKGELADFQRAVRLSPASAYRWADLSDAEFALRDEAKAKYAMTQALNAGPRSPVILMRAANLYFQIGDTGMVERQLLKLLSDPGLSDYYEGAFLTYSRLGVPVDQILTQGVPPRREVLSSLLTFFTKVNKPDDAIVTWKWASNRGLVDGGSMGRFFRYLIAANRQDEAQNLWQSYVQASAPAYRTSDWIYNSGFEKDPLDSPFDWKVDWRQDVEAVRVQDVKYEGAWSFRIRFNGETNTAYHQTFQDMVLKPGKYTFSVMMKTEQVTTDEGVRLHIFDLPSQARLNMWTDTVTGTKDWTRVEKTFEVPAGVKVVRVEAARNTSEMFDNKIGGTTWLDSLSLRPQ